MALPPPTVCDRARQTRDARFDGLFFTGVRTTRIYCRPVCPAPTPKAQNIVYFASASAAASAGYRPCRRCRPELSPGIRPDDLTVRRSLLLIGEGWLDDGSVDSLAAEAGVSARHLRRLFVDKVGATPLAFHQTRRLLLARQLLCETSLPITEVALAAGFASIRRFNSAFKAACGMPPSDVRRLPGVPGPEGIRLRLAYRPPLDFGASLDTLRRRALAGIEHVTTTSYRRGVGIGRRAFWFSVTADATRPELLLDATGVPADEIQPLVRRVRRMFDVDADLGAAHRVLDRDPDVARSVASRPGLRLTGAWDGFEASVRAVLVARLGHVDGMRALDHLTATLGTVIDRQPTELSARFPSAERVAGFADDAGVRAVASAVADRRLLFDIGQPPDAFVAQLVAVSGLSLTAAQAVAMQALGDPDACGIDVGERADAWRPWRAYATIHLMPAQQA